MQAFTTETIERERLRLHRHRHGLSADLPGIDPVVLFRRAVGGNPDGWQQQVLLSQSPRVILNCSRQSGKSTVTALVALCAALFHPHALVLVLSRALRQSQELFHTIISQYRAAKPPVPADRETTLMLNLANGSRIVTLPGAEATIRGYSGATLLVIDEAARVPDDLYYAVLPMLAVSGGRLMILSTPFGKRGFFFQEWTTGEGWERIEVPATMCPRIDPTFLTEMQQRMGTRWFNQEFMCSFEDAVGAVFDYDVIQAALDDTMVPLFGDADSVLAADVSPLQAW